MGYLNFYHRPNGSTQVEVSITSIYTIKSKEAIMLISKQINGLTWIDKTHHELNSQTEHCFPYSMLCDSQ
jgi:hypothetical protein